MTLRPSDGRFPSSAWLSADCTSRIWAPLSAAEETHRNSYYWRICGHRLRALCVRCETPRAGRLETLAKRNLACLGCVSSLLNVRLTYLQRKCTASASFSVCRRPYTVHLWTARTRKEDAWSGACSGVTYAHRLQVSSSEGTIGRIRYTVCAQ